MQKTLNVRDFTLLIAVVVIGLFFAWRSDFNFVSARNLSNLSVELSITAVLALGMLLIIVPGEIDLSVGSGVGLFGGVAAVLVFWHDWPAPLAMALAAATAVAVWAGMGALIVTQRIPSFIITLAGLLVFRGVQWMVIENATIPVRAGGQDNLYSLLTTWHLPPRGGYLLVLAVMAALVYAGIVARRRRRAFGFPLESAELAFLKLFIIGQLLLMLVLVCNQHRGVPLSALILGAVALAVWVLTQHTRFGRYLYAIGGNREAAVISGVPVPRVVIGAFALMGLIVALDGLMQTAYGGYSTTGVGEYMELDAIAACVIGGTSLKGGRGSVVGVIFGALLMAVLLNGMNLLAYAPETKLIVRGSVLALAVWVDMRFARR
ncbi:MAG: hypothetical protein WD042_16425 [Phycisphaeraceae bacterium]